MNLSPDMLILAVLSERAKYESLIGAVQNDTLPPEMSWVLRWFKPFFKLYPTLHRVDPQLLFKLIKSRSTIDTDKEKIVKHILKQINSPIDDALATAATQQLNDRALAASVT